jgi:putative phosphoesterase
MKIGVISDTHNFLDPQVASIFAGVEHILHGGDIGLPRILLELQQIAPVTAVLGNTDDAGFGYSLTQSITLAERKFLVHHIVNPRAPTDGIAERIERDRPDVVVFGHTHKPFAEEIGGRLFFNTGYAGKQRFGLDRTVAVVHCEPGVLTWQYFALG